MGNQYCFQIPGRAAAVPHLDPVIPSNPFPPSPPPLNLPWGICLHIWGKPGKSSGRRRSSRRRKRRGGEKGEKERRAKERRTYGY